jgi:hypothetical protein
MSNVRNGARQTDGHYSYFVRLQLNIAAAGLTIGWQ